jgi:hypothetical protein
MNRLMTASRMTSESLASAIELENGILKQRQGMILVFVIVVMLLSSLMGIIILTSARTELSTVSNQSRGQEAFGSADTAAMLSVLFSRVLLHPVLGPPDQLIQASGGLTSQTLSIEFSDDEFRIDKMLEESPYSYDERYLEAGVSSGPNSGNPHISFKVNDKLVASSVISINAEKSAFLGFSRQAMDKYDQSGGPGQPIDMVVTVIGSPTSGQDSNDQTRPQSIVNIIIRELL